MRVSWQSMRFALTRSNLHRMFTISFLLRNRKRDLIDADAGEETITSDYVCVRWNDPVLKKFDEFAEKFGLVVMGWRRTCFSPKTILIWAIDDWFFSAGAMDKDGNLWDVTWYPQT